MAVASAAVVVCETTKAVYPMQAYYISFEGVQIPCLTPSQILAAREALGCAVASRLLTGYALERQARLLGYLRAKIWGEES